MSLNDSVKVIFDNSVYHKIIANTSRWLALYDTDEVDLLGARNLIAQIRKELQALPGVKTNVILVEEIMRMANCLSEEGSTEEAEGIYYVADYITTGKWNWGNYEFNEKK